MLLSGASVGAAFAELGLYIGVVTTFYIGDGGSSNILGFDEGAAVLLSALHLFTWTGTIVAEYVVNHPYFVVMIVVAYFLVIVADAASIVFRLTATPIPEGAMGRVILVSVLAGLAGFQLLVNLVRITHQREGRRRFVKVFGAPPINSPLGASAAVDAAVAAAVAKIFNHPSIDTNTRAVVLAATRDVSPKSAKANKTTARRTLAEVHRASWLPDDTVRWMKYLLRAHVLGVYVITGMTLAYMFGFYPDFGVALAPVLLFAGHISAIPFELAASASAVAPFYPPKVVRGTPGLVYVCTFYPLVFAVDVAGVIWHVVLSVQNLGTFGAFTNALSWFWLVFMLALLVIGATSGTLAFVVQRRLLDQGQLQRQSAWPNWAN